MDESDVHKYCIDNIIIWRLGAVQDVCNVLFLICISHFRHTICYTSIVDDADSMNLNILEDLEIDEDTFEEQHNELKTNKCSLKTVEMLTNVDKQDETVRLLCYIPYCHEIFVLSENTCVLYILLGEKIKGKGSCLLILMLAQAMKQVVKMILNDDTFVASATPTQLNEIFNNLMNISYLIIHSFPPE